MNLSLYINSPVGPIRITAHAEGISGVHFLNDAEITAVRAEYESINARNDGLFGASLKDGLFDAPLKHSVFDAPLRDALFDASGPLNEISLQICKDENTRQFALSCQAQLHLYFDGKLKQFDLPLAQAGTPFQLKVWQQLAKIDYGATVSYQTIARRLGDPKTIRAAATANGRNNIAIIVPCHRVIGSSGDLVGYAGGLNRKRWLLEHEQRFAHGLQTLF